MNDPKKEKIMSDFKIPEQPWENLGSQIISGIEQTTNEADLQELFQNPEFQKALNLFEATGLPEIYNAELLKEFFTDPQNAKSLDNFISSYQNLATNLSEYQFPGIFQEFSEDQLVTKGYFSPNEAWQEWDSYVKERNNTAKQMREVAENLVASESSSSSTQFVARKKVEQAPPPKFKDPLEFMNKLLDMMMTMSGTMQEIAMTQSKELEVETARQEVYLTIQKSLVSISPNIGWFDKPDKDKTIKATDLWNQTMLPNLQEKNRSFKEASQEKAKQINANINRSIQLTQKLSDDFADFLSKLTSAGMALIR